jgi:spermidine synthase
MSLVNNQTAPLPISPTSESRTRFAAVLYVLFMISGTAGLIYEVVWFQLLRLTIGGNTQSLGVLLACFMGGLFLGSLFYSRLIPRHWHPLKTYACFELGIAISGLALPQLIGAVRGVYLAHAGSPESAMLLRGLLCVVSLAPPTILMGATLPALSRWVRADQTQVREISRLYAVNIVGAVAGVFASALLLLPALGLPGTNLTAVAMNVAVALLAFLTAGAYSPETGAETRVETNDRELLPVYLAYAVSGVTALAFEVLWSRLMSCVLGATVYGFAMVLGVFLTGLALGGAVGSVIAARLTHPRRTFAVLQLAVMGAVGGTALLLPWVSLFLAETDIGYHDNLWLLSLTSLIRTAIVVLPGAFFWGMCFPVVLSCIGSRQDAAKPVGRLYAFNTLGAVAGSLLTGLVLIPRYGTATGVAHLVWLPALAILVLYWPKWLPRAMAGLVAAGGVWAIMGMGWPKALCAAARQAGAWTGDPSTYLILIFLPVLTGYQLFLVRRVPLRLATGAAVTGLLLALSTSVPAELYALGRQYGPTLIRGTFDGEIILFEEGAMEPVVVRHSSQGPLQISVNGSLQASSVPAEMEHLRILGHLPALLSDDPREALVVGLGAGVTSGCLGIQHDVEHVRVVELEPKVKMAAAQFKAANHWAMSNPKITVTIDDGRHFVGTARQKYGVITSDPIEPFWAGTAALYSVEYYQQCRAHLVEGGVFMQWLGIFGIDEDGLRAMLKAFAEVFPEGGVWRTNNEIFFISSTRPLRIDVPTLRKRMASPEIAASLSFVGIHTAEDLLGHYVCSVESLHDYLAGVEPNSDSNLLVQYRGWHAYFQFDRWREQIKDVLARNRQQDPDVFIVPEAEHSAFRERIRRKQEQVISGQSDTPASPDTQPEQ